MRFIFASEDAEMTFCFLATVEGDSEIILIVAVSIEGKDIGTVDIDSMTPCECALPFHFDLPSQVRLPYR